MFAIFAFGEFLLSPPHLLILVVGVLIFVKRFPPGPPWRPII
jgi:hypothetical protein